MAERPNRDDVMREPAPGVLDAFEGRVATAAGVRNAADGALVGLVAEALQEGLWQGDRIHSPVQWVMWRAGLSRHTARQVLRLAARAGELPTTMRLLAEGRLSLDQAATVARYSPAEYEASVCGLAVNATVPQITTATRRYSFDVDTPDDGQKPARAREREMSFGTDDDGSWWARIRLHADEGQIVEGSLRTVRDRLHEAARAAAGERATQEGRPTSGTDAELGVTKIGWADALLGMANAASSSGAAGAEAAPSTSVILHLERPEPGGAEAWRAELHGGAPLPSWLRQYLLCDCDIEIAWAADGIPVATSRHQRTPPRRIRRLVEKRDGYRCRVPGCDSTLWLQVHHVVHWEDDGETVTWNLCCLCAHHHRLHHQGRLGIVGNADDPEGLVVSNEHGLVLGPSGRPRPPSADDLPRVEPYACPTGERLHFDHVLFTRRPAAGAASGAGAGAGAGTGPPVREPAA